MRDQDWDDWTVLRKTDRSDMLGAIGSLPDQFLAALSFTRRQKAQLELARAQQIVITGLGGSAAGGDLLRGYAVDKCKVPLVVNRHYDLPAYVGPDTCVIAISYSGNTEETLAAYDAAKARGAQIAVIASGGELLSRAERDGAVRVVVPSGFEPRAALGYLFVPALLLLADSGLLPAVDEELHETVEVLRCLRDELAPEMPISRNTAKRIAQYLHGKIPVIHSAAGLTEAAAYRWKTQINENANSPAYAHVYPELNHNEVVGFDVPRAALELIRVVTLRSAHQHPRIDKRMDITMSELLGPCGGVEVTARGRSPLAQLFSLLYVGEYLSAYLGLSYGIDPTPVHKIEQLKRRLAEG
jgi:glucose/mannose-6-phosphate isomerase